MDDKSENQHREMDGTMGEPQPAIKQGIEEKLFLALFIDPFVDGLRGPYWRSKEVRGQFFNIHVPTISSIMCCICTVGFISVSQQQEENKFLDSPVHGFNPPHEQEAPRDHLRTQVRRTKEEFPIQSETNDGRAEVSLYSCCTPLLGIVFACEHFCWFCAVADLGGVRGVQMHPPLVASNVFLRK